MRLSDMIGIEEAEVWEAEATRASWGDDPYVPNLISRALRRTEDVTGTDNRTAYEEFPELVGR